MKIISCGNCGVLLDTDRIPKPDIENEDGSINNEVAEWNSGDFYPTISCPCCKDRIFYNDGDMC